MHIDMSYYFTVIFILNLVGTLVFLIYSGSNYCVCHGNFRFCLMMYLTVMHIHISSLFTVIFILNLLAIVLESLYTCPLHPLSWKLHTGVYLNVAYMHIIHNVSIVLRMSSGPIDMFYQQKNINI